jgi:hypothetical protein
MQAHIEKQEGELRYYLLICNLFSDGISNADYIRRVE